MRLAGHAARENSLNISTTIDLATPGRRYPKPWHSELRPSCALRAAEFRELASKGADLHLQDALRLVADEFEREAERIEALERADPEQG